MVSLLLFDGSGGGSVAVVVVVIESLVVRSLDVSGFCLQRLVVGDSLSTHVCPCVLFSDFSMLLHSVSHISCRRSKPASKGSFSRPMPFVFKGGFGSVSIISYLVCSLCLHQLCVVLPFKVRAAFETLRLCLPRRLRMFFYHVCFRILDFC